MQAQPQPDVVWRKLGEAQADGADHLSGLLGDEAALSTLLDGLNDLVGGGMEMGLDRSIHQEGEDERVFGSCGADEATGHVPRVPCGPCKRKPRG